MYKRSKERRKINKDEYTSENNKTDMIDMEIYNQVSQIFENKTFRNVHNERYDV